MSLQEPAPEVTRLRRGECWRASEVEVFQEESTPLEGVSGQSLDIMFTLERSAPGKLAHAWP